MLRRILIHPAEFGGALLAEYVADKVPTRQHNLPKEFEIALILSALIIEMGRSVGVDWAGLAYSLLDFIREQITALFE